MSAKDHSLTATSIRRSAWAEQLLGDGQPASAASTAVAPRDAEAEARSQQFFAQVLRNLDRLEKLAAEDESDRPAGEGYEWANLIDPTGTAAIKPRSALARPKRRTLPIISLNATSFALLGIAAASHSWWLLPASAFAAAAASLLYLRGCRRSFARI
jgi:hypothetical protein